MPIVLPEIACYPENLLTELPSDVPGRSWSVVNTLARQEKSLARALLQQSIPFYLPLLPRRLQYQFRRLTSYVPVLSGYVFCFANDAERDRIWSTGRISGLWKVADAAGLQRELSHFAANLDANVTTGSHTAECLLKLARDGAQTTGSTKPSRAVQVL